MLNGKSLSIYSGKDACVGDSFRIVKYIPIDHMLEPQLWKPIGKDHSQENSRGYIFLNTNDIPRVEGESKATSEKGSLFVEKTNAIQRRFENSLDFSKFKSLFVKFKVLWEDQTNGEHKNIPTLRLTLYSQDKSKDEPKGYEYVGEMSEHADAGGFSLVKFEIFRSIVLYNKESDLFDLSKISKLSLSWGNDDGGNIGIPVCIGVISGEPFVTIVGTRPKDRKCWQLVNGSEHVFCF